VLLSEKNAIDTELAQVVIVELPRDIGIGDDRQARVPLTNRFDFRARFVTAGVIRVHHATIERIPPQRPIQGRPGRAHDDLVRSTESGDHARRCSNVWLKDG